MSQKLEKALSDSLGGLSQQKDGVDLHLTPDGGGWIGYRWRF